MTALYLIRPVVVPDLPLLTQWRARPHISDWWGAPEEEPEDEKLAEPRIALWIVELDRRPFAFIQDYDVHGWGAHPFDYMPPGARGMDLFIGEPDMVGLGHGSAFVRQHAETLFARGVPAVGADPHPDNLAARRAYEKAGFRPVSPARETPWGVAVLMDRWS